MAAIEAQQVDASANMAFDASKVETWSVTIPQSQVVTGPQIAALAAYCAQNNLTLSMQFQYLGVT